MTSRSFSQSFNVCDHELLRFPGKSWSLCYLRTRASSSSGSTPAGIWPHPWLTGTIDSYNYLRCCWLWNLKGSCEEYLLTVSISGLFFRFLSTSNLALL